MPRLGLGGKLALALVAIFVPVFVVLAVDLRVTYQSRVDSVLDGEQTSAKFLASLVDLSFDDATSLARSLGLIPAVRNLDPNAIYPILVNEGNLRPQYDDLAVVDAQGNGVVSIQNPPGRPTVNVADRPYFQQAMATGRPVLSDLIVSRATGNVIVAVAAPITNTRGEIVGAVIASLSSSLLEQRIRAVGVPDQQGVFVSDRTARVAFYLLGPETALEGVDGSDYPPVAESLRVGAFRGIVSHTLLGNERAVAAVASPKYGWIVGDSIATADIEADNLAPVLTRLSIYSALMVAVLLAALILTPRLLVAPLLTLAERMEAFGRGDLSQRADIRTGDELETVANAFNRMAEEIKVRREQLRDYIRTISHDLRNPLTVIQANAQLLQRRLQRAGLKTDAEEIAGAIIVAARRMNTMIQDLVDSERAESGAIGAPEAAGGPSDLHSGPVREVQTAPG